MEKYCQNCGTQMAEDEKFCAICGQKFECNLTAQTDIPKKKLTDAVIQADLQKQKHTAVDYIKQALLLGLMLLVLYLGRPAIMIFSIPWAINVYKMLRYDKKRSERRYWVVERLCEEKEFVEGDENPDQWRLWFSSMTEEKLVALQVQKDFYDATELEEAFFIVFLQGEKIPCLCYRKSEWMK